MKKILNILLDGNSLTYSEAYQTMSILMSGQARPEQMGALLGMLRLKGETSEEIAGFASYLIENMVSVSVNRNDVIDCCGTGGDGSNTFNISTATAFILAGAGLAVAKHGNRSVSSKCGSADVLEILGVPINNSPEDVALSIEKNGFGFLFAPLYHPAFKIVAENRKALGIRTVFNILGPLLNPVRVKRQVIGVFDRSLTTTIANALKKIGFVEAMIVSSKDGLDEISISDVTYVSHLKGGKVHEYQIEPENAGLARSARTELAGGNATNNARIIESILRGAPGACRNVVLLNAAAGLLVGNVVNTMADGVTLAAEVIDDGRALRILHKLRGEI